MRRAYDGFESHELAGGLRVFERELPNELRLGAEDFSLLWDLHPTEYHDIRIHGRLTKTPRWQQAYGRNYVYSGSVNNALPLETLTEPIPLLGEMIEWARSEIDSRLNAALLNWYDGELGHYIGKHRDKTTGLLPDSCIVTLSFGETRIFRLRPWKSKDPAKLDLEAKDGSVLVIPLDTNAAYTHEITKTVRARGRRVSVTLRSFE